MYIIYAFLIGFIISKSAGYDELTRMRMTGELRKACSRRGAVDQPPSRVNTTSRLIDLRNIMKDPTGILTEILDAYIVTSDDEHQTEYVSSYDKRREYISGFSGSSGTAVITMNKAALWTDGRYHLQADDQLNCDWLLMRTGQHNIPTISEWLKDQLNNRPKGRIGIDPKLMSAAQWNSLEYDLENSDLELVEVDINLIDKIWKNHEEVYADKDVFVWDVKYAGKNWTTKVKELRKELEKEGAEGMVVTALPEIAWLLNIRGRDIPYNPFVQSYVLISQDIIHLYVNQTKLRRNNINVHLNSIYGAGPNNVKLRNYDDIWKDLPTFCVKWKTVLVPSHYVYSKGVSRKIYKLVPEKKMIFMPSPIIFLKARKNEVEVKGMEEAHVRDATIMCKFFAYLEQRIEENELWTETQVAKLINEFRFEHNMSLGNSFVTIAAYGSNGALPHYEPTNATDFTITRVSTLVLDSGGQYYDGTTDVSRTLHFGKPSIEQREAYTRVLQGQIDLATLKFPSNLKVQAADVLTRAPLWKNGYNYHTSSGHGIGTFLDVHESPISLYYNDPGEELYFKPGNFFTNEPGFYAEGEFGIRLENVLEVIELDYWPNDDFGNSFYGFKDVTLVPYEPKLINISLLTTPQRIWLNDYNTRIRTIVGAELKSLKRQEDAFFWMMEKTKHIPIYGGSSIIYMHSKYLLVLYVFVLYVSIY